VDKIFIPAVEAALREDSAGADLTSRLLLDPSRRARARIVARQTGVLCGAEIAAFVFRRLDPSCRVRILKRDGSRLSPGDAVLEAEGRLPRLLAAERTALNFIQQLSGVATLTAQFVDRAKGTRAKILDTRKTVPGLRALQKYAVRCGGGTNHRMGLADAAMVKDNHLSTLEGAPSKLLTLKKKLPKGTALIVEAKTQREIGWALAAQADVILLDNMSLSRLRAAIRRIRAESKARVEVSGGVNLRTVRAIARLNPDRISIGALTHSAPALDLSLDLELR
jgi:nicotinate-nucleotide pyrophosphorylase (carboxylating)